MYSDSLRYFVSDYIAQGYPSFGQKIHIEHSLPKSWWGSHEWAAYKDLNNLFPADGSTNLSKSDNPLGIVFGTPIRFNGVSKSGAGNYPDYTGNVFEPADQYKGDFARAYFYMATAYEHYQNLWDTSNPKNIMQNNTYPVFKPWAMQLLLQWHRQDPVSSKELTRNNKVHSIQGNRNPFIDYPELAEYIWGNAVGIPWNTTTNINNPKSFIVFHNKAQNKIHFQNITNNSQLAVRIFDATGICLFQTMITSDEVIDISNYANRLFIVQISNLFDNSNKYLKIF